MSRKAFSIAPAARRLLPFRCVALILSLLAVVLRTVNLLFFFDADIGYYQADSLLPLLYPPLILLGTVFFFVYALLFLRKELPLLKAYTLPTMLAAIPAALAFGFAALTAWSASAEMQTEPSAAPLLPMICAAAGLLYFLIFLLNKHAPITALLTGICAMLWLTSILLSSYTDVFVQMNAPLKLSIHLACLGGLLLLLAEMRLLCGVARHTFSFFSYGCAALFLLSASIPSLIADLVRALPARTLGYTDWIFLALGIFAVTRLFSPFRKEARIAEPSEVPTQTEEPQAEPIPNEVKELPNTEENENEPQQASEENA